MSITPNRLGWILSIVMTAFALSLSMPSSASGGKVKNPVIVQEGECAMDISGINEDDCTITSAPDQSGYIIFNCRVPVICPDES